MGLLHGRASVPQQYRRAMVRRQDQNNNEIHADRYLGRSGASAEGSCVGRYAEDESLAKLVAKGAKHSGGRYALNDWVRDSHPPEVPER